MQRIFPLVLALVVLSACSGAEAPAPEGAVAVTDPGAQAGPLPARFTLAGEWLKTRPGPDAPGCYEEQKSPAVIETVTDHVMVSPGTRDAQGGVSRPARYHSTTEARIVEGGETLWFRRVCPAELTRDRIVTLQRALAVRGLYAGWPTGRIDTATQAAIRAYQARRGLVSPVLSLRAAQQMGIVIWRDPETGQAVARAPSP